MSSAQNDSLQAYGVGNIEALMKAFSSVSTGLQALATELADYNKASFERGAAAFQDLAHAKSLSEAMQIQSDYVRNSYETLATEMNKIGEIWLAVAGEARDMTIGAPAAETSKRRAV